MGKDADNPRRSRRRAAGFWLCIALSGLVAGSWIKSYWQRDWVDWQWDRGAPLAEDIDLGILNAQAWRAIALANSRGRVEISVRSYTFPLEGYGFRAGHTRAWLDGPAWTWGGFAYESFPVWSPGPEDFFVSRNIYIPHWFLLLICLAAAWRCGRPWLRRQHRPGFEVLPARTGGREDSKG